MADRQARAMPPQVRRLALAASIALALVYLWLAARQFQAVRLASSLDVVSLQKAIALAPRNAAYQDLLCRYLLFDRQDAVAAVPHCQRATDLDRYTSAYWLTLALAYYTAGDQPRQEEAILKATAVDPTTPDVAWTAANFFLVQGKIPQALHQFSAVIANDPSKVMPSLELCWRAVHDVGTIEAILPRSPGPYLQFVQLLTTKQQWEDAQRVWSDLLSLKQTFDYRQALFYVDALLADHQVAQANHAWQELLSRSPALRDRARAGNQVVNGGFEYGILNAGFDWRYARQDGSTASLDSSEFHSGTQSLAIYYNGRSADAGVLQYVPVEPNTQYTLSAWLKTEGLKSGTGICVSVADTYRQAVLGQTPETLGSTGWHHVQSTFETGPETKLVTISFPHLRGPLWIEGQLWVDDISLQPGAGRLSENGDNSSPL